MSWKIYPKVGFIRYSMLASLFIEHTKLKIAPFSPNKTSFIPPFYVLKLLKFSSLATLKIFQKASQDISGWIWSLAFQRCSISNLRFWRPTREPSALCRTRAQIFTSFVFSAKVRFFLYPLAPSGDFPTKTLLRPHHEKISPYVCFVHKGLRYLLCALMYEYVF